MLFILFQIGSDQYAISTQEVQEVIPFAQLKGLPLSHPSICGLLNYHGIPVPVLDLQQVLGAPATRPVFSSRILLCQQCLKGAPDRLLGLVAEGVSEVRHIPEQQFTDPGVSPSGVSFLGRVHETATGQYVQWIHPGAILPADVVQELLYRSDSEA